MSRYCVTVNYSGYLEYYVDAESENEARDIVDSCISEDESNIISSIQRTSNVTVEKMENDGIYEYDGYYVSEPWDV